MILLCDLLARKRYFLFGQWGCAKPLNEALVNEERDFAQTRWSDALSSAIEEKIGVVYSLVRA